MELFEDKMWATLDIVHIRFKAINLFVTSHRFACSVSLRSLRMRPSRRACSGWVNCGHELGEIETERDMQSGLAKLACKFACIFKRCSAWHFWDSRVGLWRCCWWPRIREFKAHSRESCDRQTVLVFQCISFIYVSWMSMDIGCIWPLAVDYLHSITLSHSLSLSLSRSLSLALSLYITHFVHIKNIYIYIDIFIYIYIVYIFKYIVYRFISIYIYSNYIYLYLYLYLME